MQNYISLKKKYFRRKAGFTCLLFFVKLFKLAYKFVSISIVPVPWLKVGSQVSIKHDKNIEYFLLVYSIRIQTIYVKVYN